MKKGNCLRLLAGLAICLTVVKSNATLVVDENFESGIAGWTLTPNSALVNGQGHASTWAAQLGPGSGAISMSSVITAGQQYILSFWAKDSSDPTGTSQTLAVYFGTSLVPVLAVDPTTSYNRYTISLFAPSSGDLKFSWLDGNTSAYIDDISLVAVPESGTVMAGLLVLLPLGASTIRIIRKPKLA